MVIAKILCLLRQHQRHLHIGEIVAIHIDYANRPESGREAAYVAHFCRELGMRCFTRVVNEVRERDLVREGLGAGFARASASLLALTGCD